jgi:hypothetical protein
VHVSSALDASDSGRSLDPLALAVAATRPTVLRTKVSLLLVCKPWYGVAREILYGHVIFNSQESLMRSLAALVTPGSDASPFHCTKSLVLYVFDWERWNIPVVKLLKLCGNLRTLVLGYYPRRLHFDRDRMSLVVNAIPSNLPALAYIGEHYKNLAEILSSFQKLEFFTLLPSSHPVGWGDRSTSRPVFPHVRHITLSHNNLQGWNSHFPNARHLSVTISRDPLLSFTNVGTIDQSKIEHIAIGTKTWFPGYLKFGNIIPPKFMQGFQNLIILSYNPFTLNVSRLPPFQTHRTLRSVRHYIDVPMINYDGKKVDKELVAVFKASWMESWNWLHGGEEEFPSLRSIVGVYKCQGANEIEQGLLDYVVGLGGYDPRLTSACTLQCKEI